MSADIEQWAVMWGVPALALDDLRRRLAGSVAPPAESDKPRRSEAAIQEHVRLVTSRRDDILLFRNNVGALKDERGVPVRYGLANDTKAMNETVKSADLVGIYRRLITAADVGTHIGQFVCAEVKPEGWVYSGAGREAAQMRWAQTIASYGGWAEFVSSTDTPPFSKLIIYLD